jgi:hypothetical protein
LPRVKIRLRRLLVATCAVIALVLACVTGELRGTRAVDSGGSGAVSAADTFEALPPAAAVELSPLPTGGAVYVHLQFPPSRMTTADVFRPPQA